MSTVASDTGRWVGPLLWFLAGVLGGVAVVMALVGFGLFAIPVLGVAVAVVVRRPPGAWLLLTGASVAFGGAMVYAAVATRGGCVDVLVGGQRMCAEPTPWWPVAFAAALAVAGIALHRWARRWAPAG